VNLTNTLEKTLISEGRFVLIGEGETPLQFTLSLSHTLGTLKELENPSLWTCFYSCNQGSPRENLIPTLLY